MNGSRWVLRAVKKYRAHVTRDTGNFRGTCSRVNITGLLLVFPDSDGEVWVVLDDAVSQAPCEGLTVVPVSELSEIGDKARAILRLLLKGLHDTDEGFHA